MNTRSLISVIIPSYKSRGGLQMSVDSVLAQSNSTIEVIVVDDNNPDTPEREATEELMQKYADDNRVIYIKHEANKNGAAARNTGIRASRGEYIAFLDDDDSWKDDKLEKQLDFLKSHPEFDAVYTFTQNSKGYIPWTIPYEGDVIIPLLMNRSRMYTSTLLMTRKSVLAIGGFDESFRRHQDYEFLVKFFNEGFKIGCIQEALTIYTPLGGNSPKGKDFEFLKDKYLAAFGTVIDELEKNHKGIKRKIFASNYAVVFYTYMARHEYGLALSLFIRKLFISPVAFLAQVKFMLKGKTKRMVSKL